MKNDNNNQEVQKICVAGAGPAGLSFLASLMQAAKENPKKNYAVTMIDKRSLSPEGLNRRQKIIITPIKLLPGKEKEVNWESFCRELFDPKQELSLNKQGQLIDVNNRIIKNPNKRQLFMRKLMLYQEDISKHNYKNYSIKDLQIALLEHLRDPVNQLKNLQVDWYDETSIQDVNVREQTLLLKKSSKNKDDVTSNIKFDTLILCEGARREVVNQLNEELIKTTNIAPFEFKPFARQPHPYHCAVRLKLDKSKMDGVSYVEFMKEAAEKNNTIGFYKELVKNFHKLGFKDNEREVPLAVVDANPYLSFFSEKKVPRFFVASEIPEEIYRIQDKMQQREKMIEWAKLNAAEKYCLPPEYFLFDDKGEDEDKKLNAVAFKVDLDYVDSPVRQLPAGGTAVLLGDAAMKSLYSAGTSSTIALLQSIQCGRDFLEKKVAAVDQFDGVLKVYHLYKQKMQKEIMPIILKNKIKNNSSLFKESDKTSILVKAIQSSDKNDLVIRDLIRNGVDPNKKIKIHMFNREFKTTPLLLAIHEGNFPATQALLELGAHPDSDVRGEYPLSLAIKQHDDATKNLLLQYGANFEKVLSSLGANAYLDTQDVLSTLKGAMTDEMQLLTHKCKFFLSDNEADDNLIFDYFRYKANQDLDYFLNLNFFPASPILISYYEMLATIQLNNVENPVVASWQVIKEQLPQEALSMMGVVTHAQRLYEAERHKFENLLKLLEGELLQKVNPMEIQNIKLLQQLLEKLIEKGSNAGDFLYVNAMYENLMNKNEKNYLQHLQEAADNNHLPSLLEIGRYFLQKNNFEIAKDHFIKLANAGAACGYTELAAMTLHPAQFQANSLDFFKACMFLDYGNELSSSYYEVLYPNIYQKIDEYEKMLKNNENSDDLITAVYARLNVAMYADYCRHHNKDLLPLAALVMQANSLISNDTDHFFRLSVAFHEYLKNHPTGKLAHELKLLSEKIAPKLFQSIVEKEKEQYLKSVPEHATSSQKRP